MIRETKKSYRKIIKTELLDEQTLLVVSKSDTEEYPTVSVKYMEDNQPKETDIAQLTPDAMIHYNEQMVAVLYPSGRVFKKKRISTIYDVKRHDFASSELMQLSYEAMVHNGGKVKRLGEKK